jgi:hypothetical protein
MRQWTSFPVSSWKWLCHNNPVHTFSWLTNGCIQITWFAHASCYFTTALFLLHLNITGTVNQSSLSLTCLQTVPEMVIATQLPLCLRKTLPEERTTVCSVWEAGRAPELVWMLWKILACKKLKPSRPAHSLVTILTEQPWLNQCLKIKKLYFHC